MLLATILLRICPNYVLCGMYEICDCLYDFALTLFYHSAYASFCFREENRIQTLCLLIFPSITNCIMYLKMYADEM